MLHSYNKGEWSEFYVFIKLLSEGKLYLLDGNQNLTEDFYTIIRISRTETKNLVQYIINKNDIIKESNGIKTTITLSNKLFFINDLFKSIVNSKGSSFSIPNIETLLVNLHSNTIKEGSSKDKADITLIINYKNTINKEIGFNIKSYMGSNPTLFNSSGATNFIFEIKEFLGDLKTIKCINNYSGNRKIRNRILAIEKNEGIFSFVKTSSPTFTNNLKRIDTQMPEILAHLILNYFQGNGHNFIEVINNIHSISLNNGEILQEDIKLKIKKFLFANALGFFPSKEWDGYLKAHGYIIVKRNGDIGCFDVFKEKELEDYLYNSVKFDTPSSTRHGFGTIYEEDEKLYIKLNLQIRFI